MKAVPDSPGPYMILQGNNTSDTEYRWHKVSSVLPADMRARFAWIAELIASHGLQNVREPYVKHIEGALSEMRMQGKDGISRALYVTAKPERVVVVRAFVKKPRKTPRREIALALKRAREIEQ